MRTKIVTSTGFELPLSDDISVSLNFSIADIRQPENRDSNYSKTIAVPSSKISDEFFKSAFQIDGYDNYNANLKADAIIYCDDNPLIIGSLQLLDIVVNDLKVTYNVNIKGNVGTLFAEWGDTLLQSLDLSAYDHDYNKTNQVASWSATTGEGYVYPMIDRGLTNGNTYDVNNFHPAVYVKQYIDSVFSENGYTYTSDFFNSSYFKRLIIPYNDSRIFLSQADLDSRYFKAKRSADYTTSYGGVIIQMNTDVSDVSNQFNTGTYTFTSTYAGSYVFKHNVGIYFTFSGISGSALFGGNRVWVEIKKKVGTTYIVISSGYLDIPAATVTNATTTATYTFINQSGVTFLNAGEGAVVTVTGSTSPLSSGTVIMNIEGDSTFEGIGINSGVVDGSPLTMADAIPKNIKIKDFFKWICLMHNLYIDVDVSNPKNYFIEPRNDFYDNGAIVDWTNKLAVDKDLIIKPLGELDAIRYEFKYKLDKDYYNTKFNDLYQYPYGTHRKDIVNDFLKNTKNIEVGFSPTPMVTVGGNDRVIPQIITVNAGVVGEMKQFNIRILYYGGVKSTANSWSYTGAVSGTTTETTYPYAGHLDDVTTPTLDINFGVPNEVFYYTNVYTNNNLFNKYYSEYIEEITDKDSKIVTGYFNLSPYDIATLDFRNQFWVDKHLLRLNKIYDYNPISSGLTKCEFIKIKKANTFTPDTVTGLGGFDTKFDNNDNTPLVLVSDVFRNSGQRSPNNFIDDSARGCYATGDGNFIGADCVGVSLQGCTNCSVSSGVSNVNLVGCSNLSITEDNVTGLNNSIVPSITAPYSVIKTITSNYSIEVTDGLILADCTSGNITIDLTYALTSLALQDVTYAYLGTSYTNTFSKIVTIKKKDSSANTVTIDADGANTIDGVATKVISTQYDKLTIQWDGTNWHIR